MVGADGAPVLLEARPTRVLIAACGSEEASASSFAITGTTIRANLGTLLKGSAACDLSLVATGLVSLVIHRVDSPLIDADSSTEYDIAAYRFANVSEELHKFLRGI